MYDSIASTIESQLLFETVLKLLQWVSKLTKDDTEKLGVTVHPPRIHPYITVQLLLEERYLELSSN